MRNLCSRSGFHILTRGAREAPLTYRRDKNVLPNSAFIDFDSSSVKFTKNNKSTNLSYFELQTSENPLISVDSERSRP